MCLLAYKKPQGKGIFPQRQFVRYVRGKGICIRVINGDIKMRTKKKQTDYGAISRSSIKKDFQRVQRYPTEGKTPQIEELSKINAERRIIHISEVSGYAKFARYIVGKLVRLKEKANVGGNSWYCEFVHDDDRKALNMAAGWSDNKKLYLLDGIKFK